MLIFPSSKQSVRPYSLLGEVLDKAATTQGFRVPEDILRLYSFHSAQLKVINATQHTITLLPGMKEPLSVLSSAKGKSRRSSYDFEEIKVKPLEVSV